MPNNFGLLKKGNIDLKNRPIVKNSDGTISTVRSISANFGNGEVLIPTVSDDGRILSNEDAIDLYRKTGKHLGIFDTPDNATLYANNLHKEQEKMYGNRINYKQTETAKKGRNGDKYLAHVQPGEVVVPADEISPELMSRLYTEMVAAGIDPARYTVGEGMSINPETGNPEFWGIKKVTKIGKKAVKAVSKTVSGVVNAVPGGSVIAPIALTAAGMPYLAAGVSGANTLGNGGSFLDAVKSAGLTYGGGQLASGGASSLGNALGYTGSTGAALGGALGGAGLGALSGQGFGGILSGAALGGGGAYLNNGGSTELGLTGKGGLTDSVGLTGSNGLFSSNTSDAGSALGGNTTSTVGSSGGSFWDNFDDLNPFSKTPPDSIYGGYGPNAEIDLSQATPGNGAGTFGADGSFTSITPLNQDYIGPASGSLADYSSNNFGNIGGVSLPENTGGSALGTIGKGALFSNILSSGLGVNANNQATEDLLEAQRQQLAMLQPYTEAKFEPGDLTQDPGYQFQLQQGKAALDAANAARGGFYSGAALKDAAEFSKGLADTTYTNAFQRWLQGRNANYNAARDTASVLGGIGSTKASSGINNSNLLARGLSGVLGGGGFGANGNSFDQNDAILRLLRGYGGF
jgi:hypothetical protein